MARRSADRDCLGLWPLGEGSSALLPDPRNRKLKLPAILALALLAAPALAQTATDGDTLRIGALIIRLHGIDAPELKQRCGDWPAGELALEALGALIAGGRLECVPKDRDRYGRTVAVCTAGDVDVGAEMVLGENVGFERSPSNDQRGRSARSTLMWCGSAQPGHQCV